MSSAERKKRWLKPRATEPIKQKIASFHQDEVYAGIYSSGFSWFFHGTTVFFMRFSWIA
jgi:hypothetical protein